METLVGTAGHIDHGKTALVKALTGTDADRLPEEKRRGITIDLGFAETTIDGLHAAFIDVPGHERFVKNMLAGAAGIDLLLLVVAADEGVMPQTREHFDICRLLGIKSGIIVLTKIDLVDRETLDLAKIDAADLTAGSFLADAPVVAVSSKTGEGITELKDEIRRMAAALPPRCDDRIPILPIDRSFSVKGFGAVVTGTLISGVVTDGVEMELLPNRQKVRIRGLQTHGRAASGASAGRRVAANLGGVDYTAVSRGMVLTEPNILTPIQIFDAEAEVLPSSPRPLKSRQRVRVHIGTAEVFGRVQVLHEGSEIAAGEAGFVQIRLEKPVAGFSGERFIIRRYSPQMTIAGGKIIDAFASKHRRKEFADVSRFLSELKNASAQAQRVAILIAAAQTVGLSFADLQARTAYRKDILQEAIDKNLAAKSIIDANGRFVSASEFCGLTAKIEILVAEFHAAEPLAKGLSRVELHDRVGRYLPNEVFQSAVESLYRSGKLAVEKDFVGLTAREIDFTPDEKHLRDRLLSEYKHALLGPPRLEDVLMAATAGTKFTAADARKHLQMFIDGGEIVKVSDEFYFTRAALDMLTERLRTFADGTADRLIDVPTFKEIAGVSRKYAIPLLEYFDGRRVTVRVRDKRMILK